MNKGAASMTAYVPRVGDVVELGSPDGWRRIVIGVEPFRLLALDSFTPVDPAREGASAYTYVRPATASERLAAGLPAAASEPALEPTRDGGSGAPASAPAVPVAASPTPAHVGPSSPPRPARPTRVRCLRSVLNLTAGKEYDAFPDTATSIGSCLRVEADDGRSHFLSDASRGSLWEPVAEPAHAVDEAKWREEALNAVAHSDVDIKMSSARFVDGYLAACRARAVDVARLEALNDECCKNVTRALGERDDAELARAKAESSLSTLKAEIGTTRAERDAAVGLLRRVRERKAGGTTFPIPALDAEIDALLNGQPASRGVMDDVAALTRRVVDRIDLAVDSATGCGFSTTNRDAITDALDELVCALDKARPAAAGKEV